MCDDALECACDDELLWLEEKWWDVAEAWELDAACAEPPWPEDEADPLECPLAWANPPNEWACALDDDEAEAWPPPPPPPTKSTPNGSDEADACDELLALALPISWNKKQNEIY
jgi:hypothetical protein